MIVPLAHASDHRRRVRAVAGPGVYELVDGELVEKPEIGLEAIWIGGAGLRCA